MLEYYIDEKGIVHNHPISFVLIGFVIVAAFFVIRLFVKNIHITAKLKKDEK